MFGRVCYFVVECDGVDVLELMWLEVLYWIDHVWSSIECVFEPVVPESIYMLLPYVLLVFLYVGCYRLI